MNSKIGRYEIIKRIGRGAQGSVYLGRDPTLDRYVAVKVLTASDAELNLVDDDGTPLEARISSKLKHPNIVPIHDAGESAAGPYLIFEYVEGSPFSEVLKSRGRMSIEDAAPMIMSILKALSTAHAAEVLHLDLSPRNILIDADNVPRVMDFGLAQYVSIAREPKEFATGTLRYMSPEHFLREPLGPWTDVFALGSTFYEVVTGQVAHALDLVVRVVGRHHRLGAEALVEAVLPGRSMVFVLTSATTAVHEFGSQRAEVPLAEVPGAIAGRTQEFGERHLLG